MISKEEVKQYLARVKELRSAYRLFDIHAHPFEILFDQFHYRLSPDQKGLYSASACPYHPPQLTALPPENTFRMDSGAEGNLKGGLSWIALREVYSHTGPKVFGDHMSLSGIDRVLLLPVASPDEVSDQSMETLIEMFGPDGPFSFGCGVPNRIRLEGMSEFLKERIKRHGIEAVKLHPNITGIDLGTKPGKERVEGMLKACGELELPLIIHGGRSPVVRHSKTAEYGRIQYFQDIDWKISPETVVIAHAGGYGCSRGEMEEEVLPILQRLLSRYPNLMIDLSGLEMDVIGLLFRKVDLGRILFGSDGLYTAPWAALVKIAHALLKEGLNLEKGLIEIVSLNPSLFMFKRRSKKTC
jgi:predicted TIM-barrel fold metal-dependent hydrolase